MPLMERLPELRDLPVIFLYAYEGDQYGRAPPVPTPTA